MNLFREVQGFHNWLDFHDVPQSAVNLWYTLITLNNFCGWKKRFNVPNSTLIQKSKLSKQSILNARKLLAEHGLISFDKGKTGHAAIYQMHSQYAKMKKVYESGTCFDQANYASCGEVKDGNKKQITAQENNNHHLDKPGIIDAAPNAYTIYEQNFGIMKPIVQDSFLSWCEDLGDEIVTLAIKLAAEKGGRTYSYLESILKEWTNENLKTLEQVKVYEQHKQKRRRAPVAVDKKAKNKEIFDKFKEADSQ
ncbi:DnaD domain-containing protein [Radiobacillus sp. PE A8.2]|uniref:DnaD domain-containing protein n=1 Tax=Radiobacillus sp. PE A8.2 TaxID=3380349 RepID=UPI00388F62A2